MESVTTLLGEWNSFNGVQFTEEAYFMAQLLGNFPLPNDSPNASPFEVPSTFWPQHELTTSIDEVDGTSLYLSNDTNERGEILVPQSRKDYKVSASSRKRSCSMADVHENKEKIKCRKSQKLVSKGNETEADHDAVFGQIMKIYGSDDDSNGSQDSSTSPRPKEATNQNSNGKTKANRGSATDPQSVYARKRRERINERLRILQSLVPGTISHKLDAVHYLTWTYLFRRLIKIMEAAKRPGVVINMGSASGLYPMISDPIYSAAKVCSN